MPHSQSDDTFEKIKRRRNHTMRNIELFLQCHVIHGDLSPYNVLYWHNELVFIDFARYGIESNPMMLADDLWQSYLRS